MIKEANLTDTLKGAGPFTIFAPMNGAINNLDSNDLRALMADKTELKHVVKYHIIADNVKTAEILMNELSKTTLSNEKIRLNYYRSTRTTTINGVSFDFNKFTATNGLVYLINGVLTPPVGNIIDVFKADPELSTLYSAVTAAHLGGFLTDQNPITVFAPTNEAFYKFGSVLTQKLFGDKNLLKTILKYHVIPGSVYEAAFHEADLHTFDSSDKSLLKQYSIFGYEIDTAAFSVKDISAYNGVVHKIRDVLIPASVKGQVDALKPTTSDK